MKYMLLVYGAEDAWSEEEREHCYVESTELTRELHERGIFRGASPLQPVATATSVRIREGKRVVTDGPFAETREQLGGYFLVEAGDLDEAIEIASRIPGARVGTVEVRPVVELPGLPELGDSSPIGGSVSKAKG
ncbi:YciI family protein [Tundrisphaera lichenicola]|uniref:YciI family protein n=1 Tax=Tundrisphaera lichenicola TaxID=2029860 RepID=UPI003EBC876A